MRLCLPLFVVKKQTLSHLQQKIGCSRQRPYKCTFVHCHVAKHNERLPHIRSTKEDLLPSESLKLPPFYPSYPPQVQVVSLLVSTADQDRRNAILRRAAAGGGALDSAASAGAQGGGGAWSAASPPPVLVPGASLQSIVAQADDVIAVRKGSGPMSFTLEFHCSDYPFEWRVRAWLRGRRLECCLSPLRARACCKLAIHCGTSR